MSATQEIPSQAVICSTCGRQVPYKRVESDANGNQGRWLAKVHICTILNILIPISHFYSASPRILKQRQSATFGVGCQVLERPPSHLVRP